MGQICDLDALEAIRAELRQRGATVVLTNGCFDLLHVGHVRYLRAARQQGDCLIVGVNGDESVRRLKGEGRPLTPEAERAEVVAALGSVDYVVLFHEDTAECLVDLLRPDVYVKGGDYGPGGKDLPEARRAVAHGGRVALIPATPGRSTSAIVASILGQRRAP
jgi:rfaE bifunctional protein nucleotidyltransferase chain/domain